MRPACLPSGLPSVPAALPGELLGAWLLRIAERYGLSLSSLLTRLAVVPPDRASPLHWFELERSKLEWATLAAALRRPTAIIRQMSVPYCRPRWPQELGCCPRCVAQASAAQTASTWQRSWMHPLTTACPQHKVWLTPVRIRALRGVHHAQALADLAGSVVERECDRGGEDATLLDGALWLQRLLLPSKQAAPWGAANRFLLARMLQAVARMMLADGEDRFVKRRLHGVTHLETGNDAWSLQGYSFIGCEQRPLHLALPDRLRPRQLLLGLVGDFLRRAPEERTAAMRLPPEAAYHCCACERTAWPMRSIAWVSPEAAAYFYGEAEIRARHSLSPAYFRECSVLLKSFEELWQRAELSEA